MDARTTGRDEMRPKPVNQEDHERQLGKPKYKIRNGPTQSIPTWWQIENDSSHLRGGQPVPTTNHPQAAFPVGSIIGEPVIKLPITFRPLYLVHRQREAGETS